MSYYTLAQRTATVASGDAAAELKTGAKEILLLEVGISLGAVTASRFALARAVDTLGTGTGAVLGQALDPAAPAATASGIVTWAPDPLLIAGSAVMHVVTLTGVIGAHESFSFYEEFGGVVIAANSQIYLKNMAANGVADVFWLWEE